MKTVVYQSFRTANVPAWIDACMQSVRHWADVQGFAYRFYDDRFFDLVPPALRARASRSKLLLADYARLVAARDLLAEGYDRAVWMDADAFVFAPRAFEIPITRGYAFCREVWLDRISFGVPQFQLTVNNSVSVFCQDQQILDFYIDAAGAILASDQELDPFSIGTRFLLKLQRAHRFPLLTTMGMFGPEMALRTLANDGPFLRAYLNYQTSPVYAANLCLSLAASAGGTGTTRSIDETTLANFVRQLQSDEGRSLNHWYDGSYTPREDEFDRPLSRWIATRQALKALTLRARGR